MVERKGFPGGKVYPMEWEKFTWWKGKGLPGGKEECVE